MKVFLSRLMIEDADVYDTVVYESANATLEGAVADLAATIVETSEGIEETEDELKERLLTTYREGAVTLGDDWGLLVSISETELGA